jgi:beta-mannosidase
VPAQVPGSIHTDLMAAGVIGDIKVDGTEAEQEWIRNADSDFSAQVTSVPTEGKVELKFHGLDTLATVTIDGKTALKTQNMHRSYSVDLTALSVGSSFDLNVHFDAPLVEALKRQSELGVYPNPYDMPYNYFRKMACSFGWDWGPITVSSGIWKPIEIINWFDGILDEVSISGDLVGETPVLTVATTARGSAENLRIQVIGSNLDLEFDAKTNQMEKFEISAAQIWHPRGFGEQNLYQVIVQLLDKNGEVIDAVEKRVGFRKVELDQSPIGDRQMFAIKVNGHRVWARGVNWIPDDPFPHRVSREQYREKIQGLFDVEVNAIRVWGGGIYESEHFYNVCDELGIVVWQDFLFACAAYPETDWMFQEVEAEAKEAIARLSSHPSLVIWCGGNECLEGFQHWGWQEPLAGKPWGSSFYLNLLPELVSKFDGTRPYIPGSPFSTLSEDVKDPRSGTIHIWDVWNDVGYQRYEEYSPAFAAEFGYNGPGSWLTLTKAIHKQNLDSRDADVATHQKAFFGMDKIANGLQRDFKKHFVEGPEWYFAAQLVQARAVEIGLKHFRSLYETCSGSILWQYNDMWPALSWAVLDSNSSRKLAWYSMQDAYRPRLLHISTSARDVVLINDTQAPWADTLKINLIDSHGTVLLKIEKEIELAPLSKTSFQLAELVGSVDLQQTNGFVVASFGELRVSRRMTDEPVAEVNPQSVSIETSTLANKVIVKVTANQFVSEFCLLPELVAKSQAIVSKQRITLLPTESAVIEVVAGSQDEAELLAREIGQIAWSLNRLVA